jgi:tryptophan synthase alpha chain
MTRLQQTFADLKTRDAKALVGFISAGDPNYDTSLAIATAMCESGLDVLELGVPFSDPTSDGPAIQLGSQRAIASGMTLDKTLAMIRELRKTIDTPIIVFTYYNPILAYGPDRFITDATAAGADGVLLVDLPPDEVDEIAPFRDSDLAVIRLVAPTTPEDRTAHLVSDASGFVYLVSRTGVTGKAGALDVDAIAAHAAEVRRHTDLPICLGFGISTPEHIASLRDHVDGLVVGSAFVRVIEADPDATDLPEQLAAFVASLKAATLTP